MEKEYWFHEKIWKQGAYTEKIYHIHHIISVIANNHIYIYRTCWIQSNIAIISTRGKRVFCYKKIQENDTEFILSKILLLMFLLYPSFTVKTDLKNGITNWHLHKACTHNIAKPWSTRVEDIKRTGLWCICRCVLLLAYTIQ